MNAAKILLGILVIVAVAAVAIYLMGQFEVTRPLYEQITGTLGGWKDSIVTFFSNPWAGITSALGAIGGIGAAVGIYSTLKGKLTTSVNTANSEISTLTKQKEEALAKVTETANGYEAQVTDLQEQLKTAKANVVDTSGIQEELNKAQQNLAASRNEVNELKSELQTLNTRYDELKQLTKVK